MLAQQRFEALLVFPVGHRRGVSVGFIHDSPGGKKNHENDLPLSFDRESGT
jgi:hypothetical protein